MNIRLALQTWRWQQTRLAIVVLAGLVWGGLMPVIYSAFSNVIRDLANSGAFPPELLEFGSGSLFSLPGTVTLGMQHPLALAMVGIFAVGATQRGTLEVLLARPISRRGLYTSIAVALFVVVIVAVAAILAGFLAGSALLDLLDELDVGLMPLVLANGALLWLAFAAFGLAASVSFDRSGPAIGLSLAYLLVNYFLEILGSLWTDVAWSQEYSLFHHFQPAEILGGEADPIDLVILAAAMVIPIVYAMIVFPRRDLAAPS
jgi:ABC-type transport system involved in multi-copper enzyme maturation permease subunit